MLRDVLEGGWIDNRDLESAISQVKKFVSSVLVTTEDQFNSYLNLFKFHVGSGFSVSNKLKELGINKIIWAEYMPQCQFELTSEESYQKLAYDVETIILKK